MKKLYSADLRLKERIVRSLYQPETYTIALSFMILTMLCWGSWANTVKLCPGYRFQLFYWDYVIGLIVGALLWGFTLGSVGSTGTSFLADVEAAQASHIVWALVGGVIFNVANLLLVAAIEIAGLAVAFPVGIGLALVIGAGSSYIWLPMEIRPCCSVGLSWWWLPSCVMRPPIAFVNGNTRRRAAEVW